VTWLIHTCDMTHSYVWHDSFTRVPWLIHMCDMTHSHVWHDSFICVTWVQVRMWTANNFNKTPLYVCHDSFSSLFMTRLIPMCNMNHSYVWHGYRHPFGQLRSVTSLIFFWVLSHFMSHGTKKKIWDSYFFVPWLMTHLYLFHGSCLFFNCDMTHDYLHLWHDSPEQDIVPAGWSDIRMSPVSHINESCLTYEWVLSHIWMSQVSHMNESCLTYEWVMSHIWISYVSRTNESCLTYEWVMSHRARWGTGRHVGSTQTQRPHWNVACTRWECIPRVPPARCQSCLRHVGICVYVCVCVYVCM